MTEERTIDHALTSAEAYDLAGEYIAAGRRLGLTGWKVGVKPDPLPDVNGRHGFIIYATRLPEAEPPPAVVPKQRSLPAMQHRHVNRRR